MSKKVLFLLGSANISGGTYVILQHAQHLKKIGYNVVVALVYMRVDQFIALKSSNQCWHPALKELQFIHIDEAKNYYFDVAIFTWWATFFSFEKLNVGSYLYFVQSIESRFYDKRATFIRRLADKTYQMGVPVITEATWIDELLRSKYQNQVELVKNGIVKSLYTQQGETYANRAENKLRVLVEGPLNIFYKNVEKTIELCKQANVGEVWLLTSSVIQGYPGVDRVFSHVAISDVPKIYRSCDVIVKLSYVEGMFGPPLEMFHCGGTAIVYDVTGYDEYIVHNVNALVAKTDDEESVINYLRLLQSDRELLSRLKAGAIETAKNWIDWETSSNEFAKALDKLTTPAFSDEKIFMIHHLVTEYLNEKIEVIMEKNNTQTTKIVSANHRENSSLYELFLPISQGKTGVGIVFGKCCRNLLITKVELLGEENLQTQAKFSYMLNNIVKHPDESFECQTEMGMLVVNIDFNPHEMKNAVCNLRVEFMPVMLWENMPDTLTVSTN